MVRLRLKPSHRHVLPTGILYLLVVCRVDLGAVFEMPRSFATAVYTGQAIVVTTQFYLLLLFNLIDISRTYLGRLPTPSWIVRVATANPSILPCVVFLARICLLSFFEAVSAILLVAPRIDSRSAVYFLCPLALACAIIHTWVERDKLGKDALLVEE